MAFPLQTPDDGTFADPLSLFSPTANGSNGEFRNVADPQGIVEANALLDLYGRPTGDPSGQHLGGGAHDIVFENSLGEVIKFLETVEQTRCHSKTEPPSSFNLDDALRLHKILQTKVRPEDKKKVFEFFSDFSGNTVEKIQHAIEQLSLLLDSKEGFLGMWTADCGQTPVEMLNQYVVVCRLPSRAHKLKRAYTTVTCRRGRCLACKSGIRTWTLRWRDAMVCLSSSLQHEEDIWECPICTQLHNTKDNLKRHRKSCVDPKPSDQSTRASSSQVPESQSQSQSQPPIPATTEAHSPFDSTSIQSTPAPDWSTDPQYHDPPRTPPPPVYMFHQQNTQGGDGYNTMAPPAAVPTVSPIITTPQSWPHPHNPGAMYASVHPPPPASVHTNPAYDDYDSSAGSHIFVMHDLNDFQ